MGDLRLNETSYSGAGTGVLMLNGVNYTGIPKYEEVDTGASAVATFQTDVTAPVKKAVFGISGSASEINVTIKGANFFNEDTELGRINDTTGQPQASSENIRSKTFSPCIGGQTYFVRVGCGQNIRVYWYDSSYNFISVTNDINNVAVVAPANAVYMKMRGTRDYGTTYLNDISVNLPFDDEKYHPFSEPITRTIDLKTTRTGGSVTVSFSGACTYDDGQGNTTALDPIQPIMQLYGANCIFCDTGDTEVVYRVKEGFSGFDLKFSNGTAGTSTYTVEESGVYLLLAVYSLNGSGSITLPQGRRASYTGSFLISNSKGMVLTVAELQEGDVITMATSVSSWIANTKAVFRIPFLVSSLVDSATAGDEPIEYDLSTGSGTILCVAAAWARTLRYDYIYDESGIINNMIAGIVDTNVLIRIFTCDVSDFPTIRMKGYDGGGVSIAVLQ